MTLTVEEKREKLNAYCHSQQYCSDCVLNDESHNFSKCFTSYECLNINYSPEEDLDKALKIISEAETVNHPTHYNDGKIEVIEYIEDKKLGFCLGNAIKYISRAGKKDPTKEVEDLQKAIWYIERHIKTLEENKND